MLLLMATVAETNRTKAGVADYLPCFVIRCDLGSNRDMLFIGEGASQRCAAAEKFSGLTLFQIFAHQLGQPLQW